YPFLYKAWEKYENFDKSINEDDKSKGIYKVVCETIINKLGRDVNKHKSYCMKLIRNLGHHSYGTPYFSPKFEHCHILYNWIYNTIENSGTTNDLIRKYFNDYINQTYRRIGSYKCSYDSFDSTYLEPKKITILKIFDDNIRDITHELNEKGRTIDSPSRNFVCECVNIYKNIYQEYCNGEYASNTKSEKTCDMLEKFRRSYMEFFYNNIVKKYEIPSLYNVDHEYSSKCTSKAKTLKRVTVSEGSKDIFSEPTKVLSEFTNTIPLPMRVPNEISDSQLPTTKDSDENADISTHESDVLDKNTGSDSPSSVGFDQIAKRLLDSRDDIDGITVGSILPSVSTAAVTMSDESHSTDSSGRSTTTTALSTVVAVSSALALLYKV
ncbi:hypothetical protein PCYB_003020, partial [Plasmodium cynomolgi strain B]